MNARAAHADFATQASTFAALHAGRPTAAMVSNLHVRVETLHTGAGTLPVSVHDGRQGDAWVCSPRTTYADCAGEESARYLPASLRDGAHWLLSTLGGGLALSGLDNAVAINNWLLSTNLYPPLDAVDPASMIEEAVARWPRHTLWFRSLNEHHNGDWLDALRAAGCLPVASRQVYLYDDIASLASRRRDLKRDLSLLLRTPLRHCRDDEVTEHDYTRIAELYALLYIGKYSRHNPLYGKDFLRAWHHAGLLSFEGFRDDDGRLVCVIGLFRQGCTVTAPIVGYDTAMPQRMGLYRLAMACAYRACIENGWRLNFSAGAADFKRLRGGTPSIEYSAVYARHLPRGTRLTVAALSAITCHIGAPLLRRYRL
ncbi:GNAT family N-acetyltransferase [Pseudoxanthomonas sp. PXM02]|uniref:GNAT family N-acetyltransferase n=1 Tax=Pseudoxanthomonas sp. PXM02 TaxID=2769294 RepID=UPI00177DFEC5|nr:GNAT family N-acetyltransferase [Pseudoxanthomonas sp. PXM02]MBD9477531.1 GNAT family N-acetyltransferase [Pseudoxanthomonas sp. PXM02]